MNHRFPLTLFPALLFAAACGQSGPLFLPGDPSKIQTDGTGQEGSRPAEVGNEEDEEESSDKN